VSRCFISSFRIPFEFRSHDRVCCPLGAVHRATQCALEIQSNHGQYTSTEVDFALSCHIGISAGTVHAIHVGGVDGRWEFLVAGDPFRQLESAVDAGKSGDVVVSREAYAIVKSFFQFTKIESEASQDKDATVDYLVLKCTDPIKQRQGAPLPLEAIIEPALRGYLSRGVLARLDAKQTQWLGYVSER